MKNPLLLRTIAFLLFLISYLWGNYLLLDHGRTDLLVFLAFCCSGSLVTYVYSITLTGKP